MWERGVKAFVVCNGLLLVCPIYADSTINTQNNTLIYLTQYDVSVEKH
jgi:hypothetical protein